MMTVMCFPFARAISCRMVLNSRSLMSGIMCPLLSRVLRSMGQRAYTSTLSKFSLNGTLSLCLSKTLQGLSDLWHLFHAAKYLWRLSGLNVSPQCKLHCTDFTDLQVTSTSVPLRREHLTWGFSIEIDAIYEFTMFRAFWWPEVKNWASNDSRKEFSLMYLTQQNKAYS